MISPSLQYQLPRILATQGRLGTGSFAVLKAALLRSIRRDSRTKRRPLLHVAPTRKTVFASIATRRDTWQGTVLMVKKVLSSLLKRERSLFQVRHLGSGLVSGPVQVSECVFDLPNDTLEVVQGLVNKQFDVIVCDILNKDIILPTPLLPLSDVLDVNSKVYGAFSLIIPSVDDLDSFL